MLERHSRRRSLVRSQCRLPSYVHELNSIRGRSRDDECESVEVLLIFWECLRRSLLKHEIILDRSRSIREKPQACRAINTGLSSTARWTPITRSRVTLPPNVE